MDTLLATIQRGEREAAISCDLARIASWQRTARPGLSYARRPTLRQRLVAWLLSF